MASNALSSLREMNDGGGGVAQHRQPGPYIPAALEEPGQSLGPHPSEAGPATAPMAHSALAVCALCLLALSSACYIQNCPIGGKRSVLDMDIRKVRAAGSPSGWAAVASPKVVAAMRA